MAEQLSKSGGLIYKKIAAVMGEVEAISKERRSEQGYKFRGIDDALIALNPVFVKHGVFVLPEVVGQVREIGASKSGSKQVYSVLTMKFTLCAADDGSSVSCTMVGEAQDTGDKSSNKAMSSAFKMMAWQVFCIPTEETKDLDTEVGAQEPRGKPESPKVKIIPKEDRGPIPPRDELNSQLMSLYKPYLQKYPNTKFTEILTERYGVAETRLMPVEQLSDLVDFMTLRIGQAG